MKSKGTAYLLLAPGLLLICGLQRFYLGKIGTGLIWLLTFGLLGFGQIYDLFTLGNQVDMANMKLGFLRGVHNENRNTNTNAQSVIVNVQAPTIPYMMPATIHNAGELGSRHNVPAILNPTEEMERLVSLLERGHITTEEFQARKVKLLA